MRAEATVQQSALSLIHQRQARIVALLERAQDTLQQSQQLLVQAHERLAQAQEYLHTTAEH